MAATAALSWRTAEPSNELSWAREGSHKCTRRVGDRDELALVKSLANDDDILDALIKQEEMVNGLMKMLEISDARLTRRPASSSNSWVTM